MIEPIAALALEHEINASPMPAPLATPEPLSSEDLRECLEMVPDCVAELYRMRVRSLAPLARSGHVKTGRNDPCPLWQRQEIQEMLWPLKAG